MHERRKSIFHVRFCFKNLKINEKSWKKVADDNPMKIEQHREEKVKFPEAPY